MRFVALVSGGKDSTFAVAEAIAQGHELVGLAHLSSFSLSGCLSGDELDMSALSVPGASVERDSWMYQSVGSEIVPLLALAFDKPLFWVEPASGDDFNALEDQYLKSFGASAFTNASGHVDRDIVRLWRLLRSTKQRLGSMATQALVSGAILSNYQRSRIEIVCRALGWVSISPLWQRDQSTLLSTMGGSSGIDARLIRNASIGLNSSHLMMALCPKKPDNQDSKDFGSSTLGSLLKKLSSQYGVNECGEGGEYESFSIDADVFPHLKIVPLSWTLVDPASGSAPSSSSSSEKASHVRFTKVTLAEKTPNALDHLSGLQASSLKAIAAITIPYSEASNWQLGEGNAQFAETAVLELESKIATAGVSLISVVRTLVKEGRIVVLESEYHDFGALPVKDLDVAAPSPRNPLVASDPAIDQLNVTGPHFRTAGGLVGDKLGIHPTSKTWPRSNFYIECSHHVYEDCRGTGDSSPARLAKTISEATQAVMNAIGRKLAENSISFQHIYFASLTIPSMTFFGEMNPVYSSYFVPIHNPPSRVTVAQRPRHSPHPSDSSDTAKIAPSIRIEFWGLIPDHVDAALVGKLAIASKSFFAHNVLHVESYSGWAPACIGPYSQAHEVLGVDHMAGQIALIPTQMTLVLPTPLPHVAEGLVFQTTLAELKLALKHVVSLVTARSYKGGVLRKPSGLLFASMFTSVPVSLAERCIELVLSSGTTEEQEAVKYVLNSATLVMVDELPRLAKVEIQVVIDSAESILADPVDSNLIPRLANTQEYAHTKLHKSASRIDASGALSIFTRYTLSQSLTYAHTQHIILGPSNLPNAAKAITDASIFALDTVAPFIACSPLGSQDEILPSFLSAHIFFKTTALDNPEFSELSQNSKFPFTPYAALDIGAPKSWLPAYEKSHEVLALLHSKWALPLDLDD
jgi:diphthine-ammonia ligase